jgi:hypothetical protein
VFLVVGVPVLVLATVPTAHADDAPPAWSDSSLRETSDPVSSQLGGDRVAQLSGTNSDHQPTPQSGTGVISSADNPTSALADATVAARQVLATQSQPDSTPASQPAGQQHP